MSFDRARDVNELVNAVSRRPESDTHRQTMARFLALVRGERVLDVGCGHGEAVGDMARVVGAGLAVGIDLGRAPLSAGGLVRGDARRLPFDTGAFDAVRLERILHSVDDPETVVAESARVVRAGGRVVAGGPDWGSLRVEGLGEEVEGVLEAQLARPSPGQGGNLESLMSAAGLGVRNIAGARIEMTRYDPEDDAFGFVAVLREVSEGPGQLVDWLGRLRSAVKQRSFRASLVWVVVQAWSR